MSYDRLREMEKKFREMDGPSSPGLSQEGPVGRELVLEDESKLVLVGALLLISRGTPAGFCSEM